MLVNYLGSRTNADSREGSPGSSLVGRALRPALHRRVWRRAIRRYLISTFAPTSANFFWIAAASSLGMPSLIGLGAPSTRSFASFRPRLVTSRTTLITLILLVPTSVRIVLNSVFSSTAGAPPAAPPPAGIAIGIAAAALT